MASDDPAGPSAPTDRSNRGTENHVVDFAAMTAKTPVDQAFRAAFLESKLRLAHTHPASDIVARDAAVGSLASRLGADAYATFDRMKAAANGDQPVPGGVGYGVFYKDPFKTGWGRGTSIASISCVPHRLAATSTRGCT